MIDPKEPAEMSQADLVDAEEAMTILGLRREDGSLVSASEALEILGIPFPEMVGVSEAVEALEVQKMTLYRLASDQKIPEPVQRLKAGPVWLKADIEAVAVERAAERARKRSSAVPAT